MIIFSFYLIYYYFWTYLGHSIKSVIVYMLEYVLLDSNG